MVTVTPLLQSTSLKSVTCRNKSSNGIAVNKTQIQQNSITKVWRVKRSACRSRLTGSVVQPPTNDDLLGYKAIGSNYLSFVVILLLASTTPLAEAGTATHFPFLKAVVGSGLLTSAILAPTIQSRRGHQLWRVKRSAPIAVNRLGCTTFKQA